jgi:hypothetical protein
MRRPQPLPAWKKRALAVAFGFGVLYILEILARISGVEPAYKADLIGGWTMLPKMDHETLSNRQDGHEFIVSTNDDGLRTSLSPQKRAGVPRVALMGDSTTFGWGADEGGTIADGVKAEWPEAEILNAGQPGYSTTQIAEFFTAVVRRYEPDLTVVFLPMHDHNLVLVSDKEHLHGASGPVSAVRVLLATHSSLYQVIRQNIFPLWTEQFALPWAETGGEPRVPRVNDDEREANVLGMAELAKSWGGSVAIGHIPFGGDLAGEAGERYGAKWATEFSAKSGIPLVDLRDCCHGDNLTLDWDPGHLKAEGNLKVGKAAAPRLKALVESKP